MGHGDRLAEACRQSERRGDRFTGHGGRIRRLGGHFAGLMAALLLPPRASVYF